MAGALERKVFSVSGMTCTSCESLIEEEVKELEGIVEVKAVYSSSKVYVAFQPDKINVEKIISTIELNNYQVKGEVSIDENKNDKTTKNTDNTKESGMATGQIIGVGIVLFALYLIIKNTIGFNFIPEINQSTGYGFLFVTGLLTSLHCIAMCGGINLSVCVQKNINNSEKEKDNKNDKLVPSLLYNLGRVISYTAVGGIVGALGAVVSFSGTSKGIVAVIAGVFMVIMGLNMLNIFPSLRKLNPRMPKIFRNKINDSKKNKGPLVVGMLTGLMPCGPLQSMQIYALGTGSFVAGAMSMFLFSIGTVPLMFAFGAVSSFLSGNFTRKLMKVSAVLVMVLGLIMLNRGIVLSGYNISSAVGLNSVLGVNTVYGNIAKVKNDVQIVETSLESGTYEPIIIQKGIPVKWTIKANKGELNGCNNAINIQEFGIENKKLVEGENIISFTPEKEGDFVYSCWMGMISSNIKVVDNIDELSDSDKKQPENVLPPSGSCGGGCCGQ